MGTTLSPQMIAALRHIAGNLNSFGWCVRFYGLRTATVAALVRRGLVERKSDAGGQVRPTAAGRAMLAAPQASPRAELIAAVRAHAEANYNTGGWDVIVEAFDDEQISEVIGRARTLKGALKKFAPVNDVIADRRSQHDAEIRAAVGTPSTKAEDHYRVGGDYTWQQPGCACGREFASDKAADAHVVAIQQAAGTYEPTQQGFHPDGSFVSWKHDEHSGEAWAVRTYPGKVGRASIEIVETAEGYETVERYIPGWAGQLVFANYCNSDGAPF